MDNEKFTLSSLRQEIIDNNLQVKAIIQDILSFRGSAISELEGLNEAGRLRLSALRKCIEKLDDWARDECDPELSKEVDTHREQFSRTLQSFRKANITTMLEIEKSNRDELFTSNDKNSQKTNSDGNASTSNSSNNNNDNNKTSSNENTVTSSSNLRQRSTFNKSSLLSQEENVTERMLSISRHLSETTQKSAATLETLIASSQNVGDTRDELLNTGGTITKSGKLLRKYGRRECTDKILIFFAFIFFLACVFYIVLKRMF